MRILFICNLAPVLNTGAHQRLSHVLKGVASAGDVTLVYPIKDAGGPELQALRPFCREVFTFSHQSLAGQRDALLPQPAYWIKHKLRYLHPTQTAFMQERRSREGTALVAKLCTQPFDLIWVQRVSSIQMLPPSLTTRVIVDLDDLEHRSLHGRLKLGSAYHMTPLYWLEYHKLRRLEQSLHALPYEFSVCSESDWAALGSGSKVWVVPNGTSMPDPATSVDREDPKPNLMFVGTMSYQPNIDAVLFFNRNILPKIRHEIPDIGFFIVGRDPTYAILKLDDGKSVTVTGTVPEVGKYLRPESVLVAPIRFGSGTRIKILEAMAHEMPVVSTTLGAEGLAVQSGKHLLIADSPTDFANACTLLLKDGALRKRLGDAAQQLVRQHYQWETVERMVGEIVQGSAIPERPVAERCSL